MTPLRSFAVLMLLAPTVGCVVVVEGEGDFTADLTVSDPCDLVSIGLEAGDVSVTRADVSEVLISWGSTGIADAPDVSTAVVDGVLELEGRCAEGLTCGIDVALLVPSGVALDIQTGRGDVTLSGTNGGALVETGAGDVALLCVAGDVHVATGAGDVSGSCIQSSTLSVTTEAGDVVLDWTGPVQEASLHTSGGDVIVGVPYGNYALDLYAADGDIILAGVTPDDEADGSLRATSDAGDLLLSGL